VDRSSAGALVEAPKAPRRVGCGEGVSSSPLAEGCGTPSPEKFLLFDLKMEHFAAVFKPQSPVDKQYRSTYCRKNNKDAIADSS